MDLVCRVWLLWYVALFVLGIVCSIVRHIGFRVVHVCYRVLVMRLGLVICIADGVVLRLVFGVVLGILLGRALFGYAHPMCICIMLIEYASPNFLSDMDVFILGHLIHLVEIRPSFPNNVFWFKQCGFKSWLPTCASDGIWLSAEVLCQNLIKLLIISASVNAPLFCLVFQGRTTAYIFHHISEPRLTA